MNGRDVASQQLGVSIAPTSNPTTTFCSRAGLWGISPLIEGEGADH